MLSLISLLILLQIISTPEVTIHQHQMPTGKAFSKTIEVTYLGLGFFGLIFLIASFFNLRQPVLTSGCHVVYFSVSGEEVAFGCLSWPLRLRAATQ